MDHGSECLGLRTPPRWRRVVSQVKGKHEFEMTMQVRLHRASMRFIPSGVGSEKNMCIYRRREEEVK